MATNVKHGKDGKKAPTVATNLIGETLLRALELARTEREQS